MLLASNSEPWVEEKVQLMRNEFKMKVIQEPKLFVGLEIERDNDVTFIHQCSYIEKLIRKFGLKETLVPATPMETRLKIENCSSGSEDSEFSSLIDTLLYLARGSHPNIAFAISFLSRWQNRITLEIMNCARRILKYLKKTSDLKPKYSSSGVTVLEAFINASFAP